MLPLSNDPDNSPPLFEFEWYSKVATEIEQLLGFKDCAVEAAVFGESEGEACEYHDEEASVLADDVSGCDILVVANNKSTAIDANRCKCPHLNYIVSTH